MIVDDDPEFGCSISALLRLRGYQVVGEAGSSATELPAKQVRDANRRACASSHGNGEVLPTGDAVGTRATTAHNPSLSLSSAERECICLRVRAVSQQLTYHAAASAMLRTAPRRSVPRGAHRGPVLTPSSPLTAVCMLHA